MKTLEFEYRCIKFKLNLMHRINLLTGKSGTGKTFILSALEARIANDLPNNPIKNTLIFNIKNQAFISALLNGNYPGYTVFIDNANILFRKYPGLTDFIIHDSTTYYVICGRGKLGGLPIDLGNSLKPELKEIPGEGKVMILTRVSTGGF